MPAFFRMERRSMENSSLKNKHAPNFGAWT